MAISKLTGDEIREISASYGVAVTGTSGTTPGRVVVYLFCLFILFPFLSFIGALILTAPIRLDVTPYFQLAMLGVWLFLVLGTVKLFVANVPKLTGALLTSLFGGALHVLGPGLHIKYPWEGFRQDDYISLRAISLEHESRFVVKGGTAAAPKGGVGVTFKWTVQYGPFLPLLPLYVRTEEKAITDGFAEVVENAINEAILTKSLDKILEKATVDELQESLGRSFVGEEVNGAPIRGALDSLGNSLEERFGLRVELSTLGPPKFDHDYEQAIAASVIREVIANDAEGLAVKLEMPKERALEMLMILNKETVSKQIFSLQGDDAIQALAPALMGALRNAGDAGRGVQTARARKGGGKPTTPTT